MFDDGGRMATTQRHDVARRYLTALARFHARCLHTLPARRQPVVLHIETSSCYLKHPTCQTCPTCEISTSVMISLCHRFP